MAAIESNDSRMTMNAASAATPIALIAKMRRRVRVRRRRKEGEHHHDDARHREMKPGAARKAQQQAEQQDADDQDVGDADAARQHPLEHHQRRPDQERAEHVGVLEAAERAVIGREQIVGAGKQMEITGDAGQRDQGRGQHIGRAHGGEARHRVVGEQAGEQHCRHRQIDRGAGILHRLLLAGHIEQRQQSGDVPDQQQQEQQRDVALEPHAGDEAGEREHAHQRVMRRRLDEGDRACQYRDVQAPSAAGVR